MKLTMQLTKGLGMDVLMALSLIPTMMALVTALLLTLLVSGGRHGSLGKHYLAVLLLIVLIPSLSLMVMNWRRRPQHGHLSTLTKFTSAKVHRKKE